MYIYQINILFNHKENTLTEHQLEQIIEEYLKSNDGEIVSSIPKELTGNNYGKCKGCGCWTSDHTQENFISFFSNGAKINGAWFCDICMPIDHPNAF